MGGEGVWEEEGEGEGEGAHLWGTRYNDGGNQFLFPRLSRDLSRRDHPKSISESSRTPENTDKSLPGFRTF